MLAAFITLGMLKMLYTTNPRQLLKLLSETRWDLIVDGPSKGPEVTQKSGTAKRCL